MLLTQDPQNKSRNVAALVSPVWLDGVDKGEKGDTSSHYNGAAGLCLHPSDALAIQIVNESNHISSGLPAIEIHGPW